MSVVRDLLRSTATQGPLQSFVAFCSPGVPSVTGRPARWCCSHLSAHASHVTRPQHDTYKGSTSVSNNCKLQQQARQTTLRAAGAPKHRLVQCQALHSNAQQETKKDHQNEGGNLDDDVEVEPGAMEKEQELEGQDDLDDDELQSMLQDDDDTPGATTDTANTDWGSKALLVVQQMLQQASMQELALFSLMASPKHKQLKIRLDKPSDEYGSPTLDEIAVFSQQFSDEYHKAMGEAAEDVAVEVSSPGAERPVRLPQDLERFQHLPMLVTFQLADSSKTDTKVLELVAYNEAAAAAEWKLADVRQNRSGKGVSKLSKKQAGQRYTIALSALIKVNLHLEV